MKQILLAAALFVSTTSFTEDPNEKVLDAFERTFSQATDVKWTEVNDNFEANFSQADIKLKVQYDADGNMMRSIRYYKGKVLPIFIQSRVQKKFPEKTIHSVTEITTPESISYHIILEDDKNWMNVQSDVYGNITVEKKYTKG
jgi:hypothetical protein